MSVRSDTLGGVFGFHEQGNRCRLGNQLLGERGLVEKQNVAIEYRWVDYRWERLHELIMDLVRRPVTAIAALSGSPTAIAANVEPRRVNLISDF
jgi:hypothetical protein